MSKFFTLILFLGVVSSLGAAASGTTYPLNFSCNGVLSSNVKKNPTVWCADPRGFPGEFILKIHSPELTFKALAFAGKKVNVKLKILGPLVKQQYLANLEKIELRR